jgi:hypothetical protein
MSDPYGDDAVVDVALAQASLASHDRGADAGRSAYDRRRPRRLAR